MLYISVPVSVIMLRTVAIQFTHKKTTAVFLWRFPRHIYTSLYWFNLYLYSPLLSVICVIAPSVDPSAGFVGVMVTLTPERGGVT